MSPTGPQSTTEIRQRRPPHPHLRGLVLGYRGFDLAPALPRRRMVLPDGVVKLMIGFEGSLRVVDATDPRRALTAASLLNGMRTTASVAVHRGRISGLTVLLTPLAAYRLLGTPMDEVAHRPLDLADVLGVRVMRQLTDAIGARRTWEDRFALLDNAFGARLEDGPDISPEVGHAWHLLHRSRGRATVTGLADATGWSIRQLQRRFRQQVGLSPKALAGVIRMHSALRLAEDGRDWAEAAAAAGYYDQPHFDRAFKAMVGCTPGRFRAGRLDSRVAEEDLDFVPDRIGGIVLSDEAFPR